MPFANIIPKRPTKKESQGPSQLVDMCQSKDGSCNQGNVHVGCSFCPAHSATLTVEDLAHGVQWLQIFQPRMQSICNWPRRPKHEVTSQHPSSPSSARLIHTFSHHDGCTHHRTQVRSRTVHGHRKGEDRGTKGRQHGRSRQESDQIGPERCVALRPLLTSSANDRFNLCFATVTHRQQHVVLPRYDAPCSKLLRVGPVHSRT
jgi:hypothetical protein